MMSISGCNPATQAGNAGASFGGGDAFQRAMSGFGGNASGVQGALQDALAMSANGLQGGGAGNNFVDGVGPLPDGQTVRVGNDVITG